MLRTRLRSAISPTILRGEHQNRNGIDTQLKQNERTVRNIRTQKNQFLGPARQDTDSTEKARVSTSFSGRFPNVGGYYRHLFCWERGNPIDFPKVKRFSGARDSLSPTFPAYCWAKSTQKQQRIGNSPRSTWQQLHPLRSGGSQIQKEHRQLRCLHIARNVANSSRNAGENCSGRSTSRWSTSSIVNHSTSAISTGSGSMTASDSV